MGAMPRRSYGDHWGVLQGRIVMSFAAWVACAVAVYPLTDEVLGFMIRPVERVVFLYPAEALVVRLRLAGWLGAALALPVVMYQAWSFVAEGLRPDERKNIVTWTAAGVAAFAVGAVFSAGLLVPAGVRFLMGFASDRLQPMITVSSYFSFYCSFVFFTGIVFEFPVVAGGVSALGLVRSAQLRAGRKSMIVLIFVVAAIFTPPDVVSQIMLALPMWCVYEIGIVVAASVERRRRSNVEA